MTRETPHSPVTLYEVAHLFGALVAETILASVHVRAQKQAGHMDASDLIKALQNTLQGGGRPHMAAVALANKMARIAWKLMVTGDNYAAKSAPAALAGMA